MHAISVKELRNKLPLVRKELEKGEEFLLIYQSRPIAKLSPASSDLSEFGEVSDDEIEKLAVREIQDDFLSKNEIKYYLSLK